MAFQIKMPIEIESDLEEVIELIVETPLFGMNLDIDKILTMFQQVIYELLDFRKLMKN